MLLLKFKATWSVSFIHCTVVLWRARKPNWLALSRPFSSMCFWTIFRINFSNSLFVMDTGLIGRKFWGNFVSLPVFGYFMTCASVYRLVKLLLAFTSTTTSGFSLLKIHDQNVYDVLDMYVFRNGASTPSVQSLSQSHIATDGQSISKSHLGLMTRY
jgi:hypothetical protein